MGHSRVRGFKVWSYLFMLARIVAEEKRPSMSFLRTILGRGIRNPGSQADAEKKKSINGKPGGVPEEGVKSGASGPQVGLISFLKASVPNCQSCRVMPRNTGETISSSFINK